MTVTEFIKGLGPDRKGVISSMHKIVTENHPNLKSRIGEMMGKEMILYEYDGAFMYALASVKSHMSFHNIIMYGHAPLYAKYSKLLNKAKFQKGCVNFNNQEQVPLNVFKEFIADSVKAAPVYLEMYKARMVKTKKKR